MRLRALCVRLRSSASASRRCAGIGTIAGVANLPTPFLATRPAAQVDLTLADRRSWCTACFTPSIMSPSHVHASWSLAALTATLVGAGSSATAQPADASGVRPPLAVSTRRIVPANIVSADLGALLAGAVAVDYERALSPSVSVVLGPRVQFGRAVAVIALGSFLREDVGFGLGVNVGFRVYLSGYAPWGLFVSTQAALTSQRASDFEGVAARWDLAFVVGYQAFPLRNLAVSLGLGPTLIVRDPNVALLALPLRATVGVAF